jgi:trimeric autotransporter adhesin
VRNCGASRASRSEARPSAVKGAVVLALIVTTFSLSGCGAGSGGSGGGGGGLSISYLSPSSAAVGIPVATISIYGQGFTDSSQVLLNGQPVGSFFSSGVLQVELDPAVDSAAGTYQFSVQNGESVSNSVQYTVYAPQQGTFEMLAVPGFLVSEGESDAPFIVAADVNGDGLADVIMPGAGTTNPAGITVLNGQSNGSLSAPQYISMPTTPDAVAVGDVDGNGTPDIVSITSVNPSTTVSVMVGNGNGSFQAPVNQQTFPGVSPGPAYLSNISGSGSLDLVLAIEQASGTAFSLVWLKNTAGTFAAPVTLATMFNNAFSVADFNGDGKPDIIYETASKSLHILMNQGNGTFNDEAVSGLNGIIGLVTVVDFNLDGLPDLIIQQQQGTGGVLYSFQGQGNGSFTEIATLSTPGEINLVTGDFDHDGFPDLAGPYGAEPSEILYFWGNGHGNFVMQPVVGPEGQYVAVGDFNGDGIPDVVVPDQFNFVSLSLGQTNRNFASPLSLTPATVTTLSTGDINGDGLPEIFVGGNPFDGVQGTVFRNLGNSSFQIGAYTDPTSFMIADLTGKGLYDLLGGATDLEIWPNNLSLNFSSSPITLQQGAEGPLTIVDIDGDGCPDIVAVGQIFYGNCQYQFTTVASTPTFGGPYVVGDFNGDGRPDIATGGYTYLNRGNRAFQTVNNTVPMSNGALAAAGDFNGDGKADIAMNLDGEPWISIWYSKGDGTFYEATELDPGQYPGALVVGDFNGDGKPDIAVGLMLSQQGCLLVNGGNGQFTRSFFASGADAIAIVSSDLNADGKPGLVIGNFVLDVAPPNVDVVYHK